MRNAKKKEVTTERDEVSRILIDDFAIRKGNTYGTAVTNADSNRVIDMIPSREVEDVVTLLREYPNLTTVVRDGSLSYRKAIETAHPGCIQISDRFHLVKNVMDGGSEYLKTLPKVFYINDGAETAQPSSVQAASSETAQIMDSEMTDSERRRMERANGARSLRELGLSFTEIGRRLGLDRKTVRTYCQAAFNPRHASRSAGIAGSNTGLLHFADQVRTMLSEGKTATAIHEAIAAEGYRGSLTTVCRYIRRLRDEGLTQAGIPKRQQGQKIERSLLNRYLYYGPDECPELTPQVLEAIKDRAPHFMDACECVSDFHEALFSGKPEQIIVWLGKALQHPVAQIRSAAHGIERDLDAVCNAVISPLSNAAAEGNNTKIKLEKRIMYGRSSFDMLRNRVLLKESRRERWTA